MKNWIATIANLLGITYGVFMIMLLSSCSASGSCNTTNGGGTGNITNLKYLTPNIVPSLISNNSYGYVQIKNTGDIAITKINYHIIDSVGGGSNIEIDSASASNCSTVATQQSCTLKLIIPANTIAGSFRIDADNANSNITTKANTNKTSSDTIGVQQVQLNSTSGVNGITLFYTNIVIMGTPYVVVTGVVNSNSVGSFNSVTLLDSNSVAIAGQEAISGNLGSGLTGLTQGATFAILLPAPHNSDISQIIKLETSNVSAQGESNNVQIGSNNYTLTTVNQGQAIISALPTMLYLTEANPSQSVTIYNTGSAVGQLSSLNSSSNNVQIVFTSTSIAPNTTAIATFTLISTVGAPINSNATLTYDNGVATALTQNIDIYQDLILPPTPTAGLTAIFNPLNTFSTSTNGGSTSQQLILTNTGNTAENGFSISGLASGFSLSNGVSANPCLVENNNITNTLESTGLKKTCDVTVSYAGSQTKIDPAQEATLNINYQYNNGIMAPTPATSAYSYQVTQSAAILSLTPVIGHDFGSILNNNIASTNYIFNLNNSGSETATNLDIQLGGAESALFLIDNTISGISNPCGSTLSNTNGNNTCQIGIQFGPTIVNELDAIAQLTIHYTPYTSGTTISTNSAPLSGAVVPVQSAIISNSLTSANGFADGSGPGSSSQTAYQVEESHSASISYTLTNSGSVPATDFYVSESSLPNGWTLGQNNCGTLGSKITLNANNGTCNITFNINSPTSGAKDFNLNVLTLNYTDQAHSSGVTPQQLSGITYVNVYNHTTIAISTSGLTNMSVAPGESFIVIATLSGGYNVTNQNIHLAPVIPNESFSYTPSSGDCSINSQSPSCTVRVNVASNVVQENETPYLITVSNTTSNGPTPSPTTINFNVNVPASLSIKLDPAVITIPGNGRSVSVATITYTGYNPNITLTLSSMNPAIATLSQYTCTVTAPQNSCQVNVNRGGTLGGTWIQATDNDRLNTAAWISSSTTALPQTGQTPTTPNDPAIFGSDGYYYTGVSWAYAQTNPTVPTQRFTVGTGAEANCITDNLTGMMWIKDMDTVSSLNNKMTWSNALSTVANLNSGSGYCGHTDWLLPNINQLRSLINYDTANTFTWLNTQGFNVKTDDSYWSSSLVRHDKFRPWCIANNNVLNSSTLTSDRYVLPVRQATGNTYPAQLSKTGQTESNATESGSDGMVQSGIAWPNPRFIESNNLESNCIIDNLTGLIWLKDLNTINNGQKAKWESAIAIIATLNTGNGYCGHKNWRLPNINEILSLANMGTNNITAWLMSATNQGGGGFINVQSAAYWTSTVSSEDATEKAWTFTPASTATVMTSNTSGMTATNYFWPVCGGN